MPQWSTSPYGGGSGNTMGPSGGSGNWNVQWAPEKEDQGWGYVIGKSNQGAMAGGSFGGPIGAAIGGGMGLIEGLLGKNRELSDAERAAMDFDALQRARIENTGEWAAKNYAGSLSDYTGALQGAYNDFLSGRGPTNLYGGPQLGQLSAFAHRAENFQPTEERQALQRTLAREKAIGTYQDPLAARLYGNLATQRGQLNANPFMSASQKARLGGEAERGVQRNVAEQGVSQLGTLYGIENQQVGKITDALISALQIAGSGYASAAQVGAQLANLYANNQMAFLSAMANLPDQYRQYLMSLMPNSSQYAAAAQGGKQGPGLMDQVGKGVDIYNQYKQGQQGSSSNPYYIPPQGGGGYTNSNTSTAMGSGY